MNAFIFCVVNNSKKMIRFSINSDYEKLLIYDLDTTSSVNPNQISLKSH